MKKLRVAVLLNGEIDRAYLNSFKVWATGQENVEITAILVPKVNDVHSRSKTHGRALSLDTNPLKNHNGWNTVIGIERFVLKLLAERSARLSVINNISSNENSLGFCPVLSYKVSEGMTARDAATLDSLRIDLVISAGTSALHEHVLQASRLGALTVDLHRNHADDSAPPGFWESYSRAPKTSYAISSVCSLQRPAKLLVEGSFRTQFSYILNKIYLDENYRAQVQRLISYIAEHDRFPETKKPLNKDLKYFSTPTAFHSSIYLCKFVLRLGQKSMRNIFKYRQTWGIEVRYGSWRDISKTISKRISAPRGKFWADPFLRHHHGKTYCFVEEYKYATKRAHISVLEISENKVDFLGIALEEDFHLSFPFLFQFKDNIYMCPEASQSQQIRLYRSVEFPLKWELCSIAIDKISAADSMFFEHEKKWWLLTTVDSTTLSDHCSELCLFYADSPLEKKWTAHPMNPICIDPHGGRNAGLIIENGKIYRAAQNQGFDQYGEGLALHEIVELNESKYSEVKVKDFALKKTANTLGCHHISTTGKITVVDYLTRKFVP
jgi:hypothetical protein